MMQSIFRPLLIFILLSYNGILYVYIATLNYLYGKYWRKIISHLQFDEFECVTNVTTKKQLITRQWFHDVKECQCVANYMGWEYYIRDYWYWYRQWLRMISKFIVIDRWYVDIGIVDGWDYWYWYRWWLWLISSMVENDIVDGCYYWYWYRWWLRLLILISLMVVIDIVDGWEWYRRWSRLLVLILSMVVIDFVDGCDWYRRWLRLIS